MNCRTACFTLRVSAHASFNGVFDTRFYEEQGNWNFPGPRRQDFPLVAQSGARPCKTGLSNSPALAQQRACFDGPRRQWASANQARAACPHPGQPGRSRRADPRIDRLKGLLASRPEQGHRHAPRGRGARGRTRYPQDGTKPSTTPGPQQGTKPRPP